ncbi:MAG TPA: NAD-dependent epimerase/dehydratase family protein [Solirubrobacteraceae bacterium]|nr:NAD-dependent epimerase/dehydratase family protein [Solirubrobacteraceae bacterium]
MKIVVTGASGNVGTSVLQALAGDQTVREIVGVARRLPSRPFAKTSWHRADVSRDELVPLFRGADVVIHLAWLIQPSRDEALTRLVNVDGSARVFEAVARAGVPALVHASSVGAYAPGPGDRAVDESWPTTGIDSSFYSRHKAEVERLLDRFEAEHSDVRTVRLRPALIFKRDAATGIRRLFMGPLLPNRLMRAGALPVLPYPRGLRTQVVHSLDVGQAYRLAATKAVTGAFNIATDPVLDDMTIGKILDARPLHLPPAILRRAAWASWKLRVQPTSPGWLDMGMLSPIMKTGRGREELGWKPLFTAEATLCELLDGLRDGAGMQTPPLDPAGSGTLRFREFATGIGASDRLR